MLRRQQLVDAGLADGEPPLFERGVADEVKPGVIVRHLAVESIGFKRFSQVEDFFWKAFYNHQPLKTVPRIATLTTKSDTPGGGTQVEDIDQRLDTEQQTASFPCNLVTLVGLHQGLPADTLHDSKCRGFVQLITARAHQLYGASGGSVP
jgi:hypothetical protein